MKTPRTTERAPAKNPAAKPGAAAGRSWVSRHRGPALIALALAALAAAWAGWRIFAPTPTHAIRNVVLISIDTCRADRLSCYGYKSPTTPHIDAVAKDGVLFQNVLTPVPMTTPGHSVMLTGTYPPVNGVRLNNGQGLGESNVTLAEVLQKAGYRTAAFVGGFPLDPQFGLNQGFDTYDGRFLTGDPKVKPRHERPAEEVNASALAWLDKNAEKPFFLFLHYFDAHLPYEPPMPYAATFAGDPYAGEIAHVDHCIGQVMDRLRATGLYDNTLVIITADHGEGLGEHGEGAHAFFIYESTLHVPLVVRMPAAIARKVGGNATLADIVPTVLDLLALPAPPQVQGVSLRGSLETGAPPERKQPIYAESLESAAFGCSPLHGVVEGRWKYIRARTQELYDLKADPAERDNLAAKEPAVARRMRERLDVMLKDMESAATKPGESTANTEAMKALQGIGYVGATAAPPTSSAFDPTLDDPKELMSTYEQLQKSLTLVNTSHLREAKTELLQVAANRPALVTPHALLAQIAVRENRLTEAAAYGEKIVSVLAQAKDADKPAPVGAGDLAVGTLDTRDLATARCNLATLWRETGNLPGAVAQYEQALRTAPGSALVHFSLARALQSAGKLPEAIEHYEQALKLKPGYAQADPNFMPALTAARSANAALQQYQQALQANPDDPEAHNNLGGVLKKIGRVDEAIAQFEQALKLKPEHAQAHYNLALALTQTGKLSYALAHFAQAVRLNPDFTPALNNLAWLLATSEEASLRDGAQAVRLAEHACQLDGRKSFGSLDTLAAAYAEAGRFSDALAAAEEALALAKGANQPAAAADIQARLALYRAGKPYREPPPAH